MSLAATALDIARAVAALGFGAALVYLAYRFLTFSVSALSQDPPYVIAGIMSGFFGLILLTAGVTVVRDWIIVSRAFRQEKTK